MKSLIIRAETRPYEHRVQLVPKDAKYLTQLGYSVRVESSSKRIFKDAEYADVGCKIVAPESWRNASKHTIVLGVKELSDWTQPIQQTHVYFAHAYKEQKHASRLLTSFYNGNGTIIDLEFILNNQGESVLSRPFCYYSGCSSSAIALLIWLNKIQHPNSVQNIPIYYDNIDVLRNELLQRLASLEQKPRALIVGRGNTSNGVTNFLDNLGISYKVVTRKETQNNSIASQIKKYELFFNCILLTAPVPVFFNHKDLKDPGRLSVISDISCEPWSVNNPLPIYDTVTTLASPSINLIEKNSTSCYGVDLVSVDNLSSFIPRESSIYHSSLLMPYLLELLTVQDYLHSSMLKSAYLAFQNGLKKYELT